METDVTYNKEKLHQKKYFTQLVRIHARAPEAASEGWTRDGGACNSKRKALLRALEHDPCWRPRVGMATDSGVSLIRR